jgi:L-ascorbate metabolism protein UlaG (beta-lactamase superfamily)
LRKAGFSRTFALDTWETFTVAKDDVRLGITAMPGTHAPGLMASLLPPVMGSMLAFETSAGWRLINIYITGDTLVFDKLKEIPKRYPQIDLMLIHLGGTRVVGIMVTMDHRQGVEVMRMMRPRRTIPIHYNDYTAFKSPLRDFQREVKKAGLESQVTYLSHGDTYDFTVNSAT